MACQIFGYCNCSASGLLLRRSSRLDRDVVKIQMQARPLSFCTQWPVGPVDVKRYGLSQKVTGLKFFLFNKNQNFWQYIALQVEACEFGHYLFCH